MSNEEMKVRFFALYIGCPLIRGGSRGILEGVTTDRFDKRCAQTVFDGLVATVRIENCILLLKPISEITDEDAIECAKIANDNVYHNVRRFDEFISIKNEIEVELNVYIGLTKGGIWGQGGEAVRNDIAAYDFLRSKGYCLPYMGKDPFKEGWAVPTNTNHSQG